jgi:UDP-N-acetylglucosamine 2-epimerase (non-hydrolysing)
VGRDAVAGRDVTHVLGARPNVMKAAPVIRARGEAGIAQRIVHTGQHYDDLLSDVFFRELHVPAPDVNLGVGSGSHAAQTAAAMVGIERDLLEHRPALTVVYGDVNSTLAGALAATKLLVPVAHVEAGLRSFDATMPEETNRRLTDAIADLLLVTSPEGVDNLVAEGIDPARVHLVGNPMIDSLYSVVGHLDAGVILERLGVAPPFGVVTLHRPSNVDRPELARTLVAGLTAASHDLPLVIPLHPRGRGQLADAGLHSGPRLQVIDPLGYVDFVALVAAAAVVITDSGGVQEETSALGVPCLTVRSNTERPITLTHGTNRLVAADGIAAAVADALAAPRGLAPRIPLWDGEAGYRIAAVLTAWLTR